MRLKIISGLLLATSFLGAQDVSLPKYKVVKGYPPNEAAAPMNAAADQGYRLLFAARLAVMRLDAAPPDTYRYLPIPDAGGQASLLNALNQHGALGYGWREESDVLEKAPHPRNYEYKTLEGLAKKSRDRSYQSLLEQGFHVVAERGFGPVFMREVGETHSAEPPNPVRVVDAFRTSNMMKDIAELAARGYRYRGPEVSRKGGGKAVSMEKCDSACRGPLEYRAFDVNNSRQLEKDLNLLGRDGFHVVPRSLACSPNLAERPAKHEQSYSYRVIDVADEKATEQSLNAADRDGFVPLGFAAHVGWNVHVFVVLEKATVSARQ
jgi:hypothetical protein